MKRFILATILFTTMVTGALTSTAQEDKKRGRHPEGDSLNTYTNSPDEKTKTLNRRKTVDTAYQHKRNHNKPNPSDSLTQGKSEHASTTGKHKDGHSNEKH